MVLFSNPFTRSTNAIFLEANDVCYRFVKKVNLRKFDKYVTEAQVHSTELQDADKAGVEA